MEIIKPNEKGNYEYKEEEYNELQMHVCKIDYILEIAHAYCEHFEFDSKQIPAILFLVELMQKELKGIYCKF